MQRLGERSTALLAAVLVSGCSLFQSAPTAELQSFRDAVAASQAGAQEILSIYEQARDQTERNDRSNAPDDDSPYPTTFSPRDVLEATESIDEIEVRRAALALLTRYANVLTALAEGRSTDEIRPSIDALGSSFSGIVNLLDIAPIPGLAQFQALVSGALEIFQRAQSREQMRTALIDGEGAVTAMLDFLIDESALYYTTSFALADSRRRLLRGAMVEKGVRARDIVAEHRAPQDDAVLAGLAERIEAARGLIRPELTLPALEPGTAGEMLTNAAQSQIETLAEAIRADAEEHVAVIDTLVAYEQSLRSYVIMLARTKASFIALRRGLDQPQSVEFQFESVMRAAAGLRSNLRDLQAAIDAAE